MLVVHQSLKSEFRKKWVEPEIDLFLALIPGVWGKDWGRLTDHWITRKRLFHICFFRQHKNDITLEEHLLCNCFQRETTPLKPLVLDLNKNAVVRSKRDSVSYYNWLQT